MSSFIKHIYLAQKLKWFIKESGHGLFRTVKDEIRLRQRVKAGL